MRILLTGKTGQVGWELNRELSNRGTVFSMDRSQMDLSKPETLGTAVQEIKPHIIINAAAYTAVDKAESEPELALTVNGISPGVIAEEAKKVGASMIHYSTDYVFDGKASSPFTEDDPTYPLNVYGKSKLAGEKAVIRTGIPHIILRTSWVYSLRGNNFLTTMQKLAQTRNQIKVVDDQIGAPTWSKAIANGTVFIMGKCINNKGQLPKKFSSSGVFNMSCSGKTTWYDFANKILELTSIGKKIDLIPIPSSEYLTPAVRPKYSLLSNRKLEQVFNYSMPEWQDSLRVCLSSVAI